MAHTKPSKANEGEFLLKPVENTNSKLDNHQDDSDSDSEPDFPFDYRGKQVAQTVGDVQQNKGYTRPDNQVDKKELDELDQRAADDKKAKDDKKGKKGK